MKILIAGSRGFTDMDCMVGFLNQLIHNGNLPSENEWIIMSGMARGADTMGVEIAKANNIPLMKFPANWAAHGMQAGYIRNAKMVQEADILVAFWDGKSRGTEHTIRIMKAHRKPVFVYNYGG